jgi:hypothetical protein
MTVKNLNGTADSKKCPCGSWIKHWENYTGGKDPTCAVVYCPNDAVDGGHVKKKGDDNTWYIVPLCKIHNGKHGEELDISDSVKLVPATGRNKCGQF